MEETTEKTYEQMLRDEIRTGIRNGVKSAFDGYNSPLKKLVEDALSASNSEFRDLLNNAIAGCVKDSEFREDIIAATRKTLAKTLVQRFGGEIEKQVNALKSDPVTRARITMAIEEVVATAK